MSAYRSKWIEILKQQQQDWGIDIHGQAIVIHVPVTEDFNKTERDFKASISTLTSKINVPAEWLKIILYNEKNRAEFILHPELRITA